MEENRLEFIADRKSICYSHVQIKLVHANQDLFFVIADGEKSLDDDSKMYSMFLSSWLSTQVGMTQITLCGSVECPVPVHIISRATVWQRHPEGKCAVARSTL